MRSGIIQLPAFQRPSGYLYLDATQYDIVDSTPTRVALNTIHALFVDGIENIATYRITPGRAGFYQVNAQATFVNLIANKAYKIEVRLNSMTPIISTIKHASFVSVLDVNCSCVVYLTAAQWLDLWVCHDAGVNTIDIAGTDQWITFLNVQRVR
jgi:hypothetical protein